MRAAFGRCYAKGLTTDPSAQGQVTLTVRIGAAGQVLGVSVQRTTNVPAQVASCMTVRAGSAEFAPPKAAKGQVTLDMTVTLTP
jgi:outer membrane biosynthesis protein TonB